MQLGTAIIIIFFVSWSLQIILSYFQMKRFYEHVSQLRKTGLTSIGMAGSKFKRRIYTVLVVDEKYIIKDAEQFSGWSVFTGLKPVKEVIGLSIYQLKDKSFVLPIQNKLRDSFLSSIDEIEKKENQNADFNNIEKAKEITSRE